MIEEDKLGRLTDLIIFFIMVMSFLVMLGQFFIQNSNILRLNELKTNGQTLKADILTTKKVNDTQIMKVNFTHNNKEYSRRIFLEAKENILGPTVELHYLPTEPDKAVYLKSLKKSYPKYIIGWTFQILAIIFAIFFLTKKFKTAETA